MKKKLVITMVVVMVLVAGGSFYGGMKYSESRIQQSGSLMANLQNFRNLPAGGSQQRTGTGVGQRGGNGGFISGEILSKDDKSVTIKMRDGGSRIVFVSDSTEIDKSTQGTLNDLKTGLQVSITGSQNTDGSLTAQSIQIRPN